MKKLLFILIALFVFSNFAFAQSLDGNAKNIMFIFDASGSMWGQIDGKNKIVIAKEAMKKFIQDLPDNINVGLVVYGHRDKKSCDDVEEIYPLSEMDKEKLITKVQSINPKGMTPICNSIQKTIDKIKTISGDKTIILISDGKETCNCNPCDFVEKIKNNNIQFIMHVVGFDVKGETREQLQCIAKAGGGGYFDAKNTKEFIKSTNEVIKKVVKYNLHVYAVKDGKGYTADVYVYNLNGKQISIRQTHGDDPAKFALKPDTYIVKVKDEWGTGAVIDMGEATVRDNELTELKAEFTNGNLHVYALKNGKGYVADAYVYDMNGKQLSAKQTYEKDPAKFILLPGKYIVKVKDEWGAGKWFELGTIDVKVNKTAEVNVNVK